jgi:disulfide oxidoreductase YuzD
MLKKPAKNTNVRKTPISEIRRALADYIKSEGCACCRNQPAHNEAEERLGKLLKVKKYADGSGYDFYAYSSDKLKTK